MLRHIIESRAKKSSRKNSPIYLINVRSTDADKYISANSKCKVIAGKDLKDIDALVTSNSEVIFEDIISLGKRDCDGLRYWLNYRAHHDTIKFYCVAHTIFKTSLQSLLPLFNYIFYTCTPGSIPLISQTISYFNLGKHIQSYWLKQFNLCPKEPGNFVFLDCSQHRLYSLDRQFNVKLLGGIADEEIDTTLYEKPQMEDMNAARSAPLPASTAPTYYADLEKTFASFFHNRDDKVEAIAIFSIIIRVIPDTILRTFDLTVAFKQWRESESKKRISLVDYVDTLLDARPLANSTKDFRVLHNYLASRCNIPKLFIRNPEFRTRAIAATATATATATAAAQATTNSVSLQSLLNEAKPTRDLLKTKLRPTTQSTTATKMSLHRGASRKHGAKSENKSGLKTLRLEHYTDSETTGTNSTME